MRLVATLVSLVCVLVAAAPARAQEPKDLDVAFQEAVNALLASDGAAASAGFGDLVDNRWAELSPKGRHGASTLLMFALLLEDRVEDACARGAALHGVMPEVFYPLGAEGGPEAARALCVLAVRTGKNTSALYVHNRSDKELTIDGTRYELQYGYKTSSTSVGDSKTDGSPAFPRTLVLPPGKGTIVISPEAAGGLFAMAVADVVCVLAAQAKTLHPDWMYLTMEDYEQTLARLRIVAGTVRWGDEALSDVVLLDFTAETPAEGGGGEGQ
jgi:hypothetical protein